MARTRFVGDAGLTARMTLVMFLLGGLFVGLVVVLMTIFWTSSPGIGILIGVAGLGLVWFQWYKSDTVAMKAMGAREVTPEQAPELHGMIDRLCALADMPKPRVGIADTDLPNAFATGRSPHRSVVVVTTGILQRLDVEELEGVLAHEALPRRAPRRPGDDRRLVGRDPGRDALPGERSTARSSAAAVATTTATGCRSGSSCWSSA